MAARWLWSRVGGASRGGTRARSSGWVGNSSGQPRCSGGDRSDRPGTGASAAGDRGQAAGDDGRFNVRVAFLGMGKMGRLMAAHVLTGGHELVIWNRTPGRVDDLVAAGAREAASIADAVTEADVAVLTLFGPESAGEVMESVHVAAPKGLLVINVTTVGPEA